MRISPHARRVGAILGWWRAVGGLDVSTRRLTQGAGRYHQPVVILTRLGVVILTRLGVDRTAQGSGLGRALVVDALHRVAAVSEVIGIRAVLIHCETDIARDFYLRRASESPAGSRWRTRCGLVIRT